MRTISLRSEQTNSKYITFPVFCDYFLPESAKLQMEEENAQREKAALEAMNDMSDDDSESGVAGVDISTDSDDHNHNHSDNNNCAVPSITEVKSGSKEITQRKLDADSDSDSDSANSVDISPPEFEISPTGQILKKKKTIFDPVSTKPFWSGEFFPLPVPEYWPPIDTDGGKKKNFVRDAGSNDKGGKMGMPEGLLEDDTEFVNLRIELHDFGEVEDESGSGQFIPCPNLPDDEEPVDEAGTRRPSSDTLLSSSTVPVRQLYRPYQTKLDFAMDPGKFTAKGRQLLDGGDRSKFMVSLCARRIKTPMWKVSERSGGGVEEDEHTSHY